MTLSEFCESRALPVVVAFAIGVLVMDWTQASRVEDALGVARRAADVAERYREACSVWPPEDLPVEELARLDKGRR